ncbi:hypothetical protein M758_5G142600 [Ceratodon purpureus]|nr:hypothetical protein M758_5G142600 [Ceratodon purpureus]KAG0616803.1 hypothetical protein M758_5G142600 [Ceratodon purpureus]KAG0616804.1 hypothetical protein M758_5G142600 [Ceratodon purpureus]KAG0616805.1 hypothetical protein M758_5G142600 [Ceratodon purpureus]
MRTASKISNMRNLWRHSSAVGVDKLLNLCDDNVDSMKGLVMGGDLLNQKQCHDLWTKLSQTTLNIRQLVVDSGAPSDAIFRPALEILYRYLEKAKLLIQRCGKKSTASGIGSKQQCFKRWWKAAVFQMQNENAFREILLEVGLSYNAIYELAKSTNGEWKDPPQDLRHLSVFEPASHSDVSEDKWDLQKRLEELANDHAVKLADYVVPGKKARRQSLAKYLLVKMDCATQGFLGGGCSAILWAKSSEPFGTWPLRGKLSEHGLLGGGNGTSVYSTKWMGIPCAKKVFHHVELESVLLKEAGILAHLKHPNIVSFFCFGNGPERGDCFIAMELMEMDLAQLIKKQKQNGVNFSLPVVVDIMVQIARGMCYLHDQGVANRDLKPLNVLVNKMTSPQYLEDCFCIKLVDFGMSKIKVEANKANTISFSGVGTTVYRAPEVHPKGYDEDGKGRAIWFKADVYSFAMTCAHLLSLQTPFEGIDRLNLYDNLIAGGRPDLPGCPIELVELLENCWDTDPLRRPSFLEISIRLEKFRHQILRGIPAPADLGTGFEYIERKLKEQASVQRPPKDSIVEGDEQDETFDSEENNKYGMVKDGTEDVNLGESRQLNAQRDCPHALCTKYSKQTKHPGYPHHLTLLQSPPGKGMFGASFYGNSKRYDLRSCTQKCCAFASWGIRPATTSGPGHFIPGAPSPALHRSWVVTSPLQHREKARLALFFPHRASPASCLRVISSPQLCDTTPQYIIPRQFRPRLGAFCA